MKKKKNNGGIKIDAVAENGLPETENITETPDKASGEIREVENYFADEKEAGSLLLYEDKTRRKECAKHFKTSNGTYKARYFETPVHYWNESEQAFREIDNELVECAAVSPEDPFDFDGYANKYGAVKVKMARDLSGGKIAVLTKGEHTLMFGFKNRKNADGGDSEASTGKAVVINYARPECKLTRKRAENIHLGGNRAEVRYDEFVPGADLQFALDGAKLKESIIVKSISGGYEYAFTLKTKNLRAELASDGKSVLLFSRLAEDVQEPVFTLPAADMTDKSGAYSDAVTYRLTQEADDAYVLAVQPDAEWIESAEREFPVIIDPTIKFGYYYNNGLTSQTISESGTFPQIIGHSFGYYNTGKLRTCVFVSNIVPNELVIRAVYNTGPLGGYSWDNLHVQVRKITGNMPVNINWSSMTASGMVSADVHEAMRALGTSGNCPDDAKNTFGVNSSYYDLRDPNNRSITLDVTDIYKASDFKGFELRELVETVGTPQGYLYTQYPGAASYLEVEYQFEKIRGGETLTHSLNRAGTGTLDLLMGDVKIIHHDLTLEHPLLPITLSHVYNSALEASGAGALEPYNQTYCGKCWRTNFHQYIGWSSKTDLDSNPLRSYIDGDGDEHIIVQNQDKGAYVLEQDETTVVTGSYGWHTLTDKYGNQKHFNPDGWLYSLVDVNGCSINIDYASPGKIFRIYDPNFLDPYTYDPIRQINFAYDAYNRLSSVKSTVPNASVTANPTNIQKDVYFNYQGNSDHRLKNIYYDISGGVDRTQLLSEASGLVTDIVDPTGRRLGYQYSGSTPNAVYDSSGDAVAINSVTPDTAQTRMWAIDSTGARRRKVTHNGMSTVYGFDRNGDCVYSYEETAPPVSGGWSGVNIKPALNFVKTNGDEDVSATLCDTARNNAAAVDWTSGWTMDNAATVNSTGVSAGKCYKITGGTGGSISKTFTVAGSAKYHKGFVICAYVRSTHRMAVLRAKVLEVNTTPPAPPPKPAP
ncbi:MAG: hypothetical protein FWD58_05550, partial [Firmicutes bacterium]|nr:hypothetical protein [Bacillota bacterium]